MAVYCPILNRNVVYLQCLDCDDKKECERIKNEQHNKDDDKKGSVNV